MANLFKKAIVFTDIHFGLKSNSLLHNQDCSRFIDWVIATAKEHGCETGMFLGDWHHHRAAINLQTLNFSLEALEKLSRAFDQFYFANFLNITLALCPPNPNVLESAVFTVRFCALLNVKFRL